MPLPYVPRSYWLPIAASVAVGVALLPMPYEYFVLLPFFLCGACVYYLSVARIADWQKWVLVGLVVLHNPVVPVPLADQTVWRMIDVASVAYFWMLARRTPRSVSR